MALATATAAFLLAFAPTAIAAPPDAPLSVWERSAIISTLRTGRELGAAPAETLEDAVLLAALTRHATAEYGLRLMPARVDRFWAITPQPHEVEAEWRQARVDRRLEAWMAALPLDTPAYRALLGARVLYTSRVEHGGWPQLPLGPVMRLTMSGPAVAVLRTRLALEGYGAAQTAAAEIFDEDLATALKAFQAAHDLEPDGVVGAESRASLNITAEQRLAQIEANLERRRWVRELPADRLEVDVAGAQAVLYADGAPQLSMRIVVGDPKHQTPMFVSRMAGVVFNPPWNVPPSIATKELLPKERATPGYLARHDFEFVDGGLRQRPGVGNSLGRVKFDFPSPFGVYLHDTPGRTAFARPNRALSHGCMRLEKPRELAALLLDWDAARVDAAIDSGETVKFPLARRPPLYVLYWTVVPRAGGEASFHRDPYGWDAELIQALAAARIRPQAAVRAPATECSVQK